MSVTNNGSDLAESVYIVNEKWTILWSDNPTYRARAAATLHFNNNNRGRDRFCRLTFTPAYLSPKLHSF